MTTIDDIGRRAGRDALADAELLADADAGLDRLLAESETEREPSAGRSALGGRRRRRHRGRSSRRPRRGAPGRRAGPGHAGGDDRPPRPRPRPRPSTTAAPSTTSATSTTATPTTTPVADTLGVSYLSPPPTLAPEAFATITVGEPVEPSPSRRMGQVVVVDVAASSALVVDPDGVSADRAAGRGTFLRSPRRDRATSSTGWCTGTPCPSLHRSSPSPSAATAPVRSSPRHRSIRTPTLELPGRPRSALGPTGVVDRTRQVGAELIGYVDTAGRPIAWPGTPPPLVTIDGHTCAFEQRPGLAAAHRAPPELAR